ncbi:MAG TPA: outer membrane protein assembly factor BamD [Bryobacteraceae bacterium]|nr:outer membrane protein assembly factor BamD [Bryobacteraceae bacterium]
MARYILWVALTAGLLTSCGFKRHKYDNPITKDTKQPDKVLYDRAINDIEHGRFEVARITLNTLINTYDQSEFLAKAKLAVADSWYREGGAAGLAQAEAEYKDFILFYPTMEEAAESQQKICLIHYKQMEKSDRDANQALRAEDECRQLIVQFPNSQFVPETQQLLRNIQESLADGEYKVGEFYLKRGDNAAASTRLSHTVDQYPLYSKADAALWDLGEAYARLDGKQGTRFRKQQGEAYARIVKDYPLSSYAEDAKKKLKDLELPIPEADPVAYNRMKWEQENRQRPGIVSRSLSPMRRGPDVGNAARSGTPAMTTLRPPVPPSVPQTTTAGGAFTGDVTATTLTGPSALDTNPDARANPPSSDGATADNSQAQQPATNAQDKSKKKKKDKKQKQQAAPSDAATSQSSSSSKP